MSMHAGVLAWAVLAALLLPVTPLQAQRGTGGRGNSNSMEIETVDPKVEHSGAAPETPPPQGRGENDGASPQVVPDAFSSSGPSPAATTITPAGRIPEPGAYLHNGLFVRALAGVSYLQARTTDGVDGRFYGGALSLAAQLGGAVTEQTILYADLWGAWAPAPKIAVNDTETPSSDDLVLGIAGLGFGVSHYFMPVNLHISASLGPTLAYVDIYTDSGDVLEGQRGAGVGANVLLGKEWWVGERGEWGIGVAGQGTFSFLPDFGDAAYRVFSLGVLFTATYN